MRYLVTGAAGFIGAATTQSLLDQGHSVVGIDNLNDYYDPTLKSARLSALREHSRGHSQFHFVQHNIAQSMQSVFAEHQPQRVIHLAAQAGVRYSIDNPQAYVESNLQGFLTILECCREHKIEHLVYASSSSVYGANSHSPFREDRRADWPVSLYAATKRSNEMMAHSYSHLFEIPMTGLRFFTVYGPWGRPDMAPMLFLKAMLAGETINVFNHGDMSRDFTYIDDIVEGVLRVADKPATPLESSAAHRVFNIGRGAPMPLMDFIHALERASGIEAKKRFLPMQAGDVPSTAAETSALQEWVGYAPLTPVQTGVERFVQWYREYFKI